MSSVLNIIINVIADGFNPSSEFGEEFNQDENPNRDDNGGWS